MKYLKQNQLARNIHQLLVPMSYFLKCQPLSLIKQYSWFFKELKSFKGLDRNPYFKKIELRPCFFDNLKYTPIDPVYFLQDTWAARKIFEFKPDHHYDVGSSVKTIGILSQFVPVTMIDIRPIEIELPNLFFKKGSVLNLPLKDNSINSLSSLCVVEHIGLGRYGDTLDSFGSEKAIKELKRVLKPGGILLISLPIDDQNKICFNAHRIFTRDYILELFSDMVILEEKYIYGSKMYDSYDRRKGFGTGLYVFQKEKKNAY